MNRKYLMSAVAATAIVAVAFAARPTPRAAQPRLDKAARIKRGEYLVTIGGCNDCHTPWVIGPDGKPGPDMSRSLSGHPQSFRITSAAQLTSDRWGWAAAPTNTAFSGPWGVSFAANLTPDKDTGTGIWTFEIFKNTIRNGRHWGVARPLNPPMPWFNYRHMSDDDLEAVFTYIHSLKPIHNEVQAPLPPQTASK